MPDRSDTPGFEDCRRSRREVISGRTSSVEGGRVSCGAVKLDCEFASVLWVAFWLTCDVVGGVEPTILCIDESAWTLETFCHRMRILTDANV